MLDGGTNQTTGHNVINFAPRLPLSKLKEKPEKSYEHSSLASMIRDFHQEVSNREREERRQIAESGRAMANVRSGKLVMQRMPVYGTLALVRPLPFQPRNDRHVYPLAQVNSSQLTSIWTLSRPKAVPRHFGNSNKSQIQYSTLERIIEHYDVDIFGEDFHQNESLSMMDYGTSIIRVFYDSHLNQITQLQPIVENVNKTVFEGYQFCYDCPKEGTPKDFNQKGSDPQCPDCGSYNVSDGIPEQQAEDAQVVGQQMISQGDIGAELLAVPASNWDMRKLVHNSDFFTYRSEVPLRLVESILGIEIQAAGANDDIGLAVINAIGTRGGSVAGWGRENLYGNSELSTRSAIMDEEWYEPSWYMGCKLSKAEPTVGGETIPAGVPLEEIFPDGICAVGFNDMTVLAGVFAEKRRIIGTPYHIQSHSGVGKGTQDAVEIAEQLNSAHSANLAVIKRFGAGGGYWYDKDVMTQKEAKALMKPGGLVGVSMRGTNYTSVEAALQQVRTGELSNSNITMVAQLANMMNVCFQTTEFTAGVANENIDINTARGQEMLAAQNQQRSAAPLRMKGYGRARIFEHVIDLFRECISIPKYFGTNDRFGLTKGRWIAGADLPEHVKCDFVPESEQPTNTYTKQNRVEQMLEKSQYFGVPFAQLVQVDPKLASWWASQFGADIPNYNYTEILIVCQDRLDDLKQLSEDAAQMSQMSGVQMDPEQLGEMLVDSLKRQLFVNEDNHKVKAQVIAEYLDDDETEDWSPAMRAGVEALIKRHYTLAAQARFAEQSADNQAQIGLMEQQWLAQMKLQNQVAQQQAQAQQAGQAQAQQDGAVQEGLGRAADLVAGEEEFAREQQGKDLDAQREEQIKKADHQRQLELAQRQENNQLELKKLDVTARRQQQRARSTGSKRR